jgi:membrane associated rhomboid family serine protease
MFLPIGDDNPHTKKPLVNYALIAVCIAAFLYQVTLPERQQELFILTYGLVSGDLDGSQGRPSALITVFTSMFMHGGWMHMLGNMLYLYIFGDNIEASLGSRRYLVFYLLCGIAAAFSQFIVAPNSMIPMVGASGAISGVMGAYMMLHPRSNIKVLVWIIIYISVWNIPAFIVLGFWIGGQFLSSMNVNPGEPGVAFMAHIGGFIAGAILVFFFKKPSVRAFEPSHSKPFGHYERPIRIRRGGSVPRAGGPRSPWDV